MNASTSRCISQCATFCSMYCSVIPLKIARFGSAWKNDAEMPILTWAGAWRGSHSASAKMRSKSARVHLRGLVWWQMSAFATSTRRGKSARVTGRCPR